MITQYRANPNYTDKTPEGKESAGNSILYGAIAGQKASLELIQTLINAGADVNQSNNYGYTPLHVLCSETPAKPDIANLLISSGAHVDAKNKDFYTPLMEAACSNNVELIEILHNNKASLNERHEYGNTALDLATSKQKEDAKNKLIDIATKDQNQAEELMPPSSTQTIPQKILQTLNSLLNLITRIFNGSIFITAHNTQLDLHQKDSKDNPYQKPTTSKAIPLESIYSPVKTVDKTHTTFVERIKDNDNRIGQER